MDNETAFALILEANISGSRRAGTGPAPNEKDNTYLFHVKIRTKLYLFSERSKIIKQVNPELKYSFNLFWKFSLTGLCRALQVFPNKVRGPSM